MSDRTTAINRALIKLGKNTITSEDEDIEQARLAKIIFDTLARAELRKHAWSFAIKRDALAVATGSPVYGYRLKYDLPTDCLRVISVGDFYVANSLSNAVSSDDAPYAIEERYLLSNDAAPLYIRYVADKTGNVAVWDAAFFEAFTFRLAYELAEPLTKSDQKAKKAADGYALAIREARRCNAIELPPQSIADDSFMLTRII